MGRSLWLLPLSVGCALLAMPAAAQDGLDAIVERELPSLVAVYKAVHAAPELSHHEGRTAALVADELRRMGLVVVEHLGRYERPRVPRPRRRRGAAEWGGQGRPHPGRAGRPPDRGEDRPALCQQGQGPRRTTVRRWA